MKTTTLEVTKENALKAYEGATHKGKELLSNLFGPSVFIKDIKERVKCIEDAFEVAGKDYNKYVADCKAAGLEQGEIDYRLLKIGIAVLNEDWVADWGNSNQRKYFPYFDMGGSSGAGFSSDVFGGWHANSRVGSRLVFKSSDLAEHAAKVFLPQYKGYFLS